MWKERRLVCQAALPVYEFVAAFGGISVQGLAVVEEVGGAFGIAAQTV